MKSISNPGQLFTRVIRKIDRFYGQIECSADPIFEDINLGTNLKIVEIGTRYGDTAVVMSRKYILQEFIAIDPYIDYKEYDGEEFSQHLRNDSTLFDKISKKIIRKSRNKVTFIRDFSNKAHSQIPNNWADFIFIDGNHEFDYVLQDLEDYWPKVANGGYMTGHDYWHRSIEHGGDFNQPMVFEAVEHFAKKNRLQYRTHGLHGKFPACFSFKKEK